MLRITRQSVESGSLRLLLEGRLTQHETAALEAECKSALPPHERLVIVLSGVRYADEAGARTLLALHRQGVTLEGGSAFVRELLSEVSS